MENYYYWTFIAEFIKNLFLIASIIVFSRQPKSKKSSNSVPFLDFDV